MTHSGLLGCRARLAPAPTGSGRGCSRASRTPASASAPAHIRQPVTSPTPPHARRAYAVTSTRLPNATAGAPGSFRAAVGWPRCCARTAATTTAGTTGSASAAASTSPLAPAPDTPSFAAGSPDDAHRARATPTPPSPTAASRTRPPRPAHGAHRHRRRRPVGPAGADRTARHGTALGAAEPVRAARALRPAPGAYPPGRRTAQYPPPYPPSGYRPPSTNGLADHLARPRAASAGSPCGVGSIVGRRPRVRRPQPDPQLRAAAKAATAWPLPGSSSVSSRSGSWSCSSWSGRFRAPIRGQT